MKKSDRRVNLWNFSFFGSTREELLNELEARLVDSARPTYIVTPNPEQIILSRSDHDFTLLIRGAEFQLPDGVGLVAASRLLAILGRAQPLTERIAGVDVAAELLLIAARRGLRVLVIGGRGWQGREYGQWLVAELTANENILSREKAVGDQRRILWWLPAYIDVTRPLPAEEERLSAALDRCRPQLVFVALGAPWQEKWMARHRRQLTAADAKLVMAVGGAFDFLLGAVPRAPLAWQRLGLEWLYRLLRQPWRWRRQLRLIGFLGLVVRSALGPVKPD
ncbi:MAG: acetylglucosaminyldiphospho-UDP acetyl-beta-D-mannosaminyltransferase [Candidatus Pacebacteria bacterium CG10_big_fil_rev_8_21_14_0_10_56_10]|nr:MAG: acetylglucosaminyldiphospho-UDP acetyl-beta-D-mannosaminyltransferase [Candidatus Pacebacteria bacterium CG10_big_fil_rev_8_21_14_0_10_56_10]